MNTEIMSVDDTQPSTAMAGEAILDHGPWHSFSAFIGRDFRLAFRGGAGWIQALMFFLVFIGLAAFAFGPETVALRSAAIPVIFLGVATSMQFTATGLFRDDLADGSLAMIFSETRSISPYLVSKLTANAILIMIPTVVLVPAGLLGFGIAGTAVPATALLVLTAVPSLVLATCVAAALSAGIGSSGLLSTILSAPLVVPVLVFAIDAAQRLQAGTEPMAVPILFLGAVTLVYAVILPPFALLSLRTALE